MNRKVKAIVMNSSSDNKLAPAGDTDVVSRYIHLLKHCLTDMIYIDDPMSLMVPYRPVRRSERPRYALLWPMLAILRAFGLHVVRRNKQKFFDYAGLSTDQFASTVRTDWIGPLAHTR